jgi:3-dehydroquinate synthase
VIRLALKLPPEGSHVFIGAGLLDELPEHVLERVPAAHYGIVTDSHVAEKYAQPLAAALRAERVRADVVSFTAGEGQKSRTTWATLTDALLARRLGRDGCIIALGGGVACDLGGFVAATYMRGLPCVQVPTSLLAMIDASIGGKTAVDVPAGKNLVGAFLQPHLVAIDPLALGTLPERELRAGLAEAVKHGAIADGEYLRWIGQTAKPLLAREPQPLAHLIRRSVEIKAAVVQADPVERGVRAVLNFGHTVAHAIEALSAYAVPHGYAVAIGMIAEAEIGTAAGVTAEGTADELRAILHGLGLPVALPAGLAPADILTAAASDKKARATRIRYALLERVGGTVTDDAGAHTVEVADDIALRALGRCLPRERREA